MTTITIYQDHEKAPVGFSTKGHAGFGDYGNDIVCAAISVLVINTINSIESFTDCAFSAEADENSGNIEFHLKGEAEPDAVLLLRSMILGLQSIQNDYGKKFLRLHFKEV